MYYCMELSDLLVTSRDRPDKVQPLSALAMLLCKNKYRLVNDDHEEEELKVEATESDREVGSWRFASPRSSENLLKLVKTPETNGILLFTSYSSGAQKLCRHRPTKLAWWGRLPSDYVRFKRVEPLP